MQKLLFSNFFPFSIFKLEDYIYYKQLALQLYNFFGLSDGNEHQHVKYNTNFGKFKIIYSVDQ